MPATIEVLEGSCLCGRVRVRAAGPFVDMLHCHCTDCRKCHGAAFATSIGVRREGFEVTAGAGALAAFTAPSGTRRSFCRRCGSKIAVDNDAWDATYLPASVVDTPFRLKPQLHMYVRSKALWYDIRDDLSQYAEGPDEGYRDAIPPLER